MHIISLPVTSPQSNNFLHFTSLCSASNSHIRIHYLQIQSKLSIPICRYRFRDDDLGFLVSKPQVYTPCFVSKKKGSKRKWRLRASRRESPYEVLGVSPSSTPDEIKRAYRKLALKFHPDVNKEANAQEKFMKIKHAYNTLLNSGSKRKYDYGNRESGYSYSTSERSRGKNSQEEEEFYGFGNFMRDVQITIGDFFKDIQEEYQNWEASARSQGKPKSLWEELAEIGEEFVEFLEKELNIPDSEKEESQNANPFKSPGTGGMGNGKPNEASGKSSIEENIDEIEATLAQLKKELGL